MKTTNIRTKTNQAFTLIEMIGVLAVIAILAALLIPKVFQSITEAKINTVPVGCATVKTAVTDHYAKFGGLAIGAGGVAIDPGTNYDGRVLVAEGILDKPFAPRVGTAATVVMDPIPTFVPEDPVLATVGTTYSLAGTGTNDVAGSHIVYAFIEDVPAADAQAISARIDGSTMSSPEATPGDEDVKGRVKYATTTGVTDVYIYLTHR